MVSQSYFVAALIGIRTGRGRETVVSLGGNIKTEGF